MTLSAQEAASLDRAYDACRKVALGHYENFPVGSVLIPEPLRKHFFALYAFMRTADDFADEPQFGPAPNRLRLLSDWREQLRRATESDASLDSPHFLALRHTVLDRRLDPSLLHRLLDAFEFDAAEGPTVGTLTGGRSTTVLEEPDAGFRTPEDVRWYTERSAEPVGRLVLQLFEYRDERRYELSDQICSALQLINFAQDAGQDLARGRRYFPLSDLEREGIAARSLGEHPNRSLVVLRTLDRAEVLLRSGSDLPELVTGRLRYELRAVVLGGMAAIRAIRAVGGDTLRKRPKLSRPMQVYILLRALTSSLKIR